MVYLPQDSYNKSYLQRMWVTPVITRMIYSAIAWRFIAGKFYSSFPACNYFDINSKICYRRREIPQRGSVLRGRSKLYGCRKPARYNARSLDRQYLETICWTANSSCFSYPVCYRRFMWPSTSVHHENPLSSQSCAERTRFTSVRLQNHALRRKNLRKFCVSVSDQNRFDVMKHMPNKVTALAGNAFRIQKLINYVSYRNGKTIRI